MFTELICVFQHSTSAAPLSPSPSCLFGLTRHSGRGHRCLAGEATKVRRSFRIKILSFGHVEKKYQLQEVTFRIIDFFGSLPLCLPVNCYGLQRQTWLPRPPSSSFVYFRELTMILYTKHSIRQSHLLYIIYV